jgi:ABC-type proline/glycine betaine transport system ATPase subunit
MDSLRVSELRFAVGPSNARPPLTVQPKNLTILVGPNNSGKSQTLREINSWTEHTELKVLSDIHLDLPLEDNAINIRL